MIDRHALVNPSIITQAGAKGRARADYAACIQSAAVIVRSRLPVFKDKRDEGDYIRTDETVTAAIAEGVSCIPALAMLTRDQYSRIVTGYTADKALAPLTQSVEAIRRPLFSLHEDIRTVANGYFSAALNLNGEPEQRPASAAFASLVTPSERIILNSPGNVDTYAFDMKGTPATLAFHEQIVRRILPINDVVQLKRIGDELLPIYNGETGNNGQWFDITQQDGAGRDEVAGGVDRGAAAQKDPSITNIYYLLVAKVDPLTSAKAMAERSRRAAAGGPTAYALADAFAASYVRGYTSSDVLSREVVPTRRGLGRYGVLTRYQLPLYYEDMAFLVNDLPGPDCRPSSGSWTCDIQLYIAADVSGLDTELGMALRGMLGDSTAKMASQREEELASKVTRRNFDWSPVTIKVSQVAGAWRSPELDTIMKKAAMDMSTTRVAVARSKREAMEEAAKRRAANCQQANLARAAGMRGAVMWQMTC